MEWGFVWMMLVLKIPVIALLLIVWWAIRSVDDPAVEPEDDGGPPVDNEPQPPMTPRTRGPHGEPSPPPPPRVRAPTPRTRVLRD